MKKTPTFTTGPLKGQPVNVLDVRDAALFLYGLLHRRDKRLIYALQSYVDGDGKSEEVLVRELDEAFQAAGGWPEPCRSE